MSAVEDTCVGNETSKKIAIKEKRQRRMAVHARIKYRQRVIKTFKNISTVGRFQNE